MTKAGKVYYNSICLGGGIKSFGSNAMEIREPCQVGNKAALSGTFHVTLGSLGASVTGAFLLIIYFCVFTEDIYSSPATYAEKTV